MSGQVRDDLVRGDAHGYGFADGFAGDFAGDHVWIARLEPGEELQDGDLQVRRGVGVDAVIGLDDYEPGRVCVRRGGGGGGANGCERGAEAAGVGCKSCGEAGRVEDCGGGAWLVYYSEVAEVKEHLRLGWGEVVF